MAARALGGVGWHTFIPYTWIREPSSSRHSTKGREKKNKNYCAAPTQARDLVIAIVIILFRVDDVGSGRPITRAKRLNMFKTLDKITYDNSTKTIEKY